MYQYRVGDKVIQTKNDYENNIMNGDIGTVKSINAYTKTMSIEFDLPIPTVEVSYDYQGLSWAETNEKMMAWREERIDLKSVDVKDINEYMESALFYDSEEAEIAGRDIVTHPVQGFQAMS